MPTTLPIPYNPKSREPVPLDRVKLQVTRPSPLVLIVGASFIGFSLLSFTSRSIEEFISYLMISCMSSIILLAAAVDEIRKRNAVIRSWGVRVHTRIDQHRGSMMATCLGAGVGLGLLIASDFAGSLSAKDALAASAHPASPQTAPYFWEGQLVDALKVGDRSLFSRSCGSLTDLGRRPGICDASLTPAD